MYAVYPRPVTTDAGLAVAPRVDQIGQDYVAVWQQQAYRSAPARRATDADTRSIAADGPAPQVCAYTDAAGNRGDLYAISGRARSAASMLAGTTAPAPATLSFVALTRAILGILCLWGIGGIVLFALSLALSRAKLRAGLIAALGIPIGTLAVGIEMLLMSLLGIPWSLISLCLPWLVLMALLGLRVRARLGAFLQDLPSPSVVWTRRIPRLDASSVPTIVLVLLSVFVVGVSAYQLPFNDGFQIYYFKAQAFYLNHSLSPYYQQAHQNQDMLFTLPSHPPMIPLGVAWLYLWIGSVNEHVSLLLWPALYLSALSFFYLVVRSCTGRASAMWLTVAFASCAFAFTGSAATGSFTDMPLGVFLVMGCGLLWRRMLRPAAVGELLIAGVLLGALPLIKEEGLPMSVIAVAAFFLLTWNQNRDRGAIIHTARWLALPWLCTSLPSLLVKLAYAPSDVLVSGKRITLNTFVPSLVVSLLGFLERAIYYWLPVVVLAAAVLIVFLSRAPYRSRLPARVWFLFLVVCGQCVVDIVAMTVNPLFDIHTEVSVAAGRLILQLTPLVMLASRDLWPVLLDTPVIRKTDAQLAGIERQVLVAEDVEL